MKNKVIIAVLATIAFCGLCIQEVAAQHFRNRCCGVNRVRPLERIRALLDRRICCDDCAICNSCNSYRCQIDYADDGFWYIVAGENDCLSYSGNGECFCILGVDNDDPRPLTPHPIDCTLVSDSEQNKIRVFLDVDMSGSPTSDTVKIAFFEKGDGETIVFRHETTSGGKWELTIENPSGGIPNQCQTPSTAIGQKYIKIRKPGGDELVIGLGTNSRDNSFPQSTSTPNGFGLFNVSVTRLK